MSNFWTAFWMNYKSKVKSKSYIIITVMMSLLIVGGMNANRIIDFFMNNNDKKMAIVTTSDTIYEQVEKSYKNIDNTLKFKHITSKQNAKEGVKNGSYEYAVIINILADKQLSATYVTENNIKEIDVTTIQTVLSQIQSSSIAQQLNLAPEDLAKLKSPVKINTEIISKAVKDEEHKESVTVLINIFILANYFLILMYAAQLATDVAIEKSSRVMELVVSSISPSKHLYSKLISTLCIGITQIGVWLLVGIISFKTGIGSSKQGFLEGIEFSAFEPSLLLYGLVFFILGFLLYGALASLLGSLVSRTEEASQAVVPLTILLLIAFYIALYGLSNPGSAIITITSYIPLFTPIVMLVRIGFLNISNWEIAITIISLTVTTFIVILLTARIYRGGVLLYGKGVFSNIKKAITLGK